LRSKLINRYGQVKYKVKPHYPLVSAIR